MKILCFTGSRAEYYILRPLLRKLSSKESVDLKLIVTGGITKEVNKTTLSDIEKDKIKILKIINIPKNYITHGQIIGYLCIKLDPLIKSFNPDLCIVYADRYESFAYAISATHLNKVILHIEAGDITEGGTYDDYIRHCITKMSHLFCTSTKKGIMNVQRLGEEPWRIIQSGLMSYDDMAKIKRNDQEKVLKELKINNHLPILIATMHPIPIDIKKTQKECEQFFKALQIFSQNKKANIIITSPNLDEGRSLILEGINKHLPKMNNTLFIESLGGFRYHTLMSMTESRIIIICGNSSSIIKEAPFYGANSLNIGERQLGREKASSQINCKAEISSILNNLENLIQNKLSDSISNPYYLEGSSDIVISFIFSIFRKYKLEKILNKKWNKTFKMN